ncbi:MAG TPA: ATP-binding protein [Spirochaetales bacterium]|nr:ATP-binding protein [Spirochaetales bacterium]
MEIQNKAELKTLFREDGARVLDGIGRLFAALDRGKWERAVGEQTFRSIHSLKSEAAFLGYARVVSIIENLEEILSHLKQTPPQEAELREFRSIYLALERDLGSILRGLELELSLEKSRERPQETQRIVELTDFEKVVLREARLRNEKLFQIDAEVEDTESMPYPRLYLLINSLELQVNVLRISPSLEILKRGKERGCSIFITTSSSLSHVRSLLDINGLKKVEIKPLNLEEVLGESDVIPRKSTLSFIYPRYRKFPGKEITLPLDFLLVQELFLSCMGATGTAGLFSRFLQEEMVEKTGVPVRSLTEKAAQLVQDLSLQVGKEITLFTEGDPEMRLPFRSYEGLNSILNHLIRNAVDHGIEFPEERKVKGKRGEGRIRISVTKQGSSFILEVSDDGRGVNEAVVRTLAEEKGIDTAFSSSEEELFALLATSGFSTKTIPSSVSGRGVGLDAAQKVVKEWLGGTIGIHSAPGEGSTVSIRFSVSNLRYPVFPCTAGEKEFLLPKILVEEIFPLYQEAVLWEGEKGVYRVGGKRYPLYSFLPRSQRKDGIGVHLAVGEKQGILLVDSMGQEQWIDSERLRKDLEELIQLLEV